MLKKINEHNKYTEIGDLFEHRDMPVLSVKYPDFHTVGIFMAHSTKSEYCLEKSISKKKTTPIINNNSCFFPFYGGSDAMYANFGTVLPFLTNDIQPLPVYPNSYIVHERTMENTSVRNKEKTKINNVVKHYQKNETRPLMIKNKTQFKIKPQKQYHFHR